MSGEPGVLTARGRDAWNAAHRSAGPVDLLLSVTAERHRLTMLTDDRDLLTVATITGQSVRLVTDTN